MTQYGLILISFSDNAQEFQLHDLTTLMMKIEIFESRLCNIDKRQVKEKQCLLRLINADDMYASVQHYVRRGGELLTRCTADGCNGHTLAVSI